MNLGRGSLQRPFCADVLLSMRVTIDLPDKLHRKLKALAVKRGCSMKEVVIGALKTDVAGDLTDAVPQKRVQLPLIRLHKGRKLDLTNFDFDDLMGQPIEPSKSSV